MLVYYEYQKGGIILRQNGSKKSLLARYPELAAQWHPSKNGKLTPDMFTSGSSKKVWWLGTCGHEWQATIVNRSLGSKCPICSSQRILAGYNDLASQNPELAAQWHPSKNGNLTPDTVTCKSNRKVWWICDRGHEWEAYIFSRSSGNGCPICRKENTTARMVSIKGSLMDLDPNRAADWHPSKNGNLTPDMVTLKSNKRVWWLCDKGHEWESTVATRTEGPGCPYCYKAKVRDLMIEKNGSLQSINPTLASQWHPTKNGDLTPTMVTPKSDKRVWWICDKGHEWESKVSNRSRGRDCPVCARRRGVQQA